METVKEIKERLNKMGIEYADTEAFYCYDNKVNYHTDSLCCCEDVPDEAKVLDLSLMGEEEYNNTILANSCMVADFDSWHDDKNAKVLVLILNDEQ